MAPQKPKAVLRRVPPPRSDRHNWLLRDHASDLTSQCGEDGMLEVVFDVLAKSGPPGGGGEPPPRWCVEFGAWDGYHLSNTWNLLANKGWYGVLIEADATRFTEMQQRYLHNKRVTCLKEMVEIEGPLSLQNLLQTTPLPRDFDFISVDVDGNDYHIWEGLTDYTPKVVVIEFNPTIPNDVIYIQERHMSVYQGSSLLALVELGKQKGYELIATTTFNAFFVRQELFPLFHIPDNSLALMRDDRASMHTDFFQLYDGTLMLAGCKKLLWHKVPIKHQDLQVLPLPKRWFPCAPPQGPPASLHKAREICHGCLQRQLDDQERPGSGGSSWMEGELAAMVDMGAELLAIPAHEEAGDEILDNALMIAAHDPSLDYNTPRQVFHVYEQRAAHVVQLHGLNEALKWYKRALYAICPSSSKNMDLLPNILCKIAQVHISCRQWRKGLFWLNLAESIEPESIELHKHYVKLYGKRGDKIALDRAKARVMSLEGLGQGLSARATTRSDLGSPQGDGGEGGSSPGITSSPERDLPLAPQGLHERGRVMPESTRLSGVDEKGGAFTTPPAPKEGSLLMSGPEANETQGPHAQPSHGQGSDPPNSLPSESSVRLNEASASVEPPHLLGGQPHATSTTPTPIITTTTTATATTPGASEASRTTRSTSFSRLRPLAGGGADSSLIHSRLGQEDRPSSTPLMRLPLSPRLAPENESIAERLRVLEARIAEVEEQHRALVAMAGQGAYRRTTGRDKEGHSYPSTTETRASRGASFVEQTPPPSSSIRNSTASIEAMTDRLAELERQQQAITAHRSKASVLTPSSVSSGSRSRRVSGGSTSENDTTTDGDEGEASR